MQRFLANSQRHSFLCPREVRNEIDGWVFNVEMFLKGDECFVIIEVIQAETGQ
jgi:hypothetical protein